MRVTSLTWQRSLGYFTTWPNPFLDAILDADSCCVHSSAPFFAEFYSMPATRSRSRSPRRTSNSPYSKDKTAKPNSRELITIKTEEKDSESNAKKTSVPESPKSNTTTTKDSKPAEKSYRKTSESSASKGSNSGNWNSSYKSKEPKSKERKFSGRCRLFVGNLVSCEDTELREMFEKYGEVAEVFVNKEKGFGFVRMVSSATTEN